MGNTWRPQTIQGHTNSGPSTQILHCEVRSSVLSRNCGMRIPCLMGPAESGNCERPESSANISIRYYSVSPLSWSNLLICELFELWFSSLESNLESRLRSRRSQKSMLSVLEVASTRASCILIGIYNFDWPSFATDSMPCWQRSICSRVDGKMKLFT